MQEICHFAALKANSPDGLPHLRTVDQSQEQIRCMLCTVAIELSI